MRTKITLNFFAVAMLLVSFATVELSAQVKISKEEWNFYAFRYLADQPLENAIDGDLNTKYAMGGGLTEGRWGMIDLGESYDIVKFEMIYVPGEVWTNNYAKGFDLYVTDYEYPINPASGPKSATTDGDPFITYADSITASIAYPEATATVVLEFEKTRGRYIWIVSNGPSADWWEVHEFEVYTTDATGVSAAKASGFSIYPNVVAVNAGFTVYLEREIAGELRIIDMTGKEVYKQSRLNQGANLVQLNLNKGLYLVSMPGQKTQKLVVK